MFRRTEISRSASPSTRRNPPHVAALLADGTSEKRLVQPVARPIRNPAPSRAFPRNLLHCRTEILERRKHEAGDDRGKRATSDTEEDWVRGKARLAGAGIVSGPFGNQRILNGKTGWSLISASTSRRRRARRSQRPLRLASFWPDPISTSKAALTNSRPRPRRHDLLSAPEPADGENGRHPSRADKEIGERWG